MPDIPITVLVAQEMPSASERILVIAHIKQSRYGGHLTEAEDLFHEAVIRTPEYVIKKAAPGQFHDGNRGELRNFLIGAASRIIHGRIVDGHRSAGRMAGYIKSQESTAKRSGTVISDWDDDSSVRAIEARGDVAAIEAALTGRVLEFYNLYKAFGQEQKVLGKDNVEFIATAMGLSDKQVYKYHSKLKAIAAEVLGYTPRGARMPKAPAGLSRQAPCNPTGPTAP